MKISSFLIFIILCCWGCAQFIPPTGGPKDEDPPELTNTFPLNGSLLFNGSLILLEFNELIDANSLRQDLIITPEPKGTYDLKVKPFGVELKFDEKFDDSTTYTFNFRNGIKDLNEKNPAINLKLVFSTGPEIDSLGISGKITNLWTGLPADKVLVGLYDLRSEDTLDLLKRKPNYFIKTDTSGKYNFENIKSSQYRILGFTDPNINLLFNNKTEIFGYLPDSINLESIIENKDFFVYPNNTNAPKIRRSVSREFTYSINIDKNYKDIQIEFLNNKDTLTHQKRDKELVFFNQPFLQDTTLTKIIVIDSSQNTLTDTLKIFFRKATNRLNTQNELLSIKSEKIRNNTSIKKPNEYILDFDFPIISIDTNKIRIIADTTYSENYNYTWIDNSQTQLSLKFNTTAQREIALYIDNGAIKNFKSDSNDTYQLINKLYQQEDYGSIDGSYNKFSGQKIVQLIDARSSKIIDYQIFTDKYIFNNALPGNYKIRIIEDINSNGQWDTADFYNNKPPERIVVSKGIIKLKSNFQLSGLQID